MCRMLAVSVISTMKVDRPEARSSDEPMRVNMRSIGAMRTAMAGTKLPQCASSTISATWRMKVDFPPMLGPVTIRIGTARSRLRSLATKGPSTARSTTGCRPSVILSWSLSRMTGRA